MEQNNWHQLAKSGPALTARPTQVAQRLYKALKPLHTNTSDSTMFNVLIRTTAEAMEAAGTINPEAKKILDGWRELEKLGDALDNPAEGGH